MLNALSIRNFTILGQADIELKPGMTSITGETGAGKSIAIDALGLCLGDRAEAAMVRHGADKAEISASFNLQQHAPIRQWLAEQDLDSDDECILRRVVSAEGRSRAFINGNPVPLQQLRELGQQLITIHGQHAHQGLLKSDQQRLLLDQYGDYQALLDQVSQHYKQWRSKQKRVAELEQTVAEAEAQRQLLEYQVNELNEFGLSEEEFSNLEAEHQRLSNGQELLQSAQFSLNLLNESDEFNILAALRQLLKRLAEQQSHDPQLEPIVSLLSEAEIQLDEASSELLRYQESVELDPERLDQLDNRLSSLMQLARKHSVKPDQLYLHHQSLNQTLQGFEQSGDELEQLKAQLQTDQQHYLQLASQLSTQRMQVAKKLAKAVTQWMQELNMPRGKFEVLVESHPDGRFGANGIDEVQFLVTTNPGQPAGPLGKVASGGELSRISLALQVLTAGVAGTPTLIFDEVDVGISGGTAAVVGKLLRQLGEQAQILCVTHLPQVAAAAHQQMNVEKQSSSKRTDTHIRLMPADGRRQELARMLAGDVVTEQALANADELLAQFA